MQHQQLAPGLSVVEAGLLERDAYPLAHTVRVRLDVNARDGRRTGGNGSQRGQHANGGGLARTIGAEEPEISGVDIKVDTADRLDGAGPPGESLHQSARLNSRLLALRRVGRARRVRWVGNRGIDRVGHGQRP